MKYCIFVVTCLVAVSVSSHAQTPTPTPDPSRLRVLAGVGIAFPVRPDLFSHGWKPGVDWSAGLGFRLTPHLTLRAMVGYDRFSLDRDTWLPALFDEFGIVGPYLDTMGRVIAEPPAENGFVEPIPGGLDFTVSGGDLSLLSVSGELEIHFVHDQDGRPSPYVTVGGGVSYVSGDDVTVTGRARRTIEWFNGLESVFEGPSEAAATLSVGAGVDLPATDRLELFFEGRFQPTFVGGRTIGHVSFRGGVRVGVQRDARNGTFAPFNETNGSSHSTGRIDFQSDATGEYEIYVFGAQPEPVAAL